MTIASHHPSADLMLSYSAGTASPSHALSVATHLEFCSSCRKSHQRNNAIGGKLIDELKTTGDMQVSDSLKTSVFALLDSRPQIQPEAETQVNLDADSNSASQGIPRALKRLVPKGFSALNWKTVSSSARTCQLFKDENGTIVSLLKLKPGGRIAKHKHLGKEFTVVLTGAFSDEDGVYREGDFLFRDDSDKDTHSPVATRDAECICLTIQEAPLQFTGWLFKFFNPLVRNQFQAS